MTEIKIPAPEELVEYLAGVHTLLTSSEWERAAVVFAYTDIGGPRNSAQPEPPRMNIKRFTELGIKGLTTRKSVVRYRNAWVWAISNGWAIPVHPGDIVTMPRVAFPPWPETTAEDYDADGDPDEYSLRSPRTRHPRGRKDILVFLAEARVRLERALVELSTVEVDDDLRDDVLTGLAELEELGLILKRLAHGEKAGRMSAAQIEEARRRWTEEFG